jgi:hypothetical protein
MRLSYHTRGRSTPGASITNALVYDVPVGTDPETIELRDGPFSDGVTVGL